MIVVKNLCKNFGDIEALDNINFCINKGEVVSLLGPNGAGKTTLMRLIAGYLQPSLGEVNVYSYDVNSDRVKALNKIGYMPENTPLYQDMSVYEFLKFIANLRNIKSTEFVNNFKDVVAYLKLEDVINQRIETLSKGFKSRVGIAAALIHKPKVLILDEPTEGLDPNQKFEVRNLIKAYGKHNIVLVSTHIMEEVEAIATRVILINKGKLVRDTTPDELRSISSEQNLEDAFRKITTEK